MRKISSALFNELTSRSARIGVGWLITRTDGTQVGFTTHDQPFTYGSVAYTPLGFNPGAVVSKSDASVDNMEVQVLISDEITEQDLRGGVWANASVVVFWNCPYNPEWGTIVIRTGILGQTVIKNGQWTAQLRSLLQQLQQPFGMHFLLICQAELGDQWCGVHLTPGVWKPNHTYSLGLLTDAKVGSVVKPSVDNSHWYVSNYTTESFYLTGYSADGSGQFTISPSQLPTGTGGGATFTGSVTDNLGGPDGAYSTVLVPAADNLREPSQPAQGLSGNDDLGPNDQTQVAVGPAPDNLSEYQYQGTPVDIFGIKIAFLIGMLSSMCYSICIQLHGGWHV